MAMIRKTRPVSWIRAVTRGSGNVFRDLGLANADVAQFKAILAAEIIKVLDREGLSVRGAHVMSIINRLGSRLEMKVRVRRTETNAPEVTA
jgi:hypothetical protein